MPTMIQRRENTASILTALGELPPNATPAQRRAHGATLTDDQINANADRLLALLGYPQQAAA